MKLKEKLTEIQNELKVGKNHYNSYGGFYYRNQEDILVAVKPILKIHGLSLFISDTIETHGNANYIKTTVTIFDDNETITVSAYAREILDKKKMDSSQLTGAASTYARKYALNGLFLLDDAADPDSLKSENTKTVKEKPALTLEQGQKMLWSADNLDSLNKIAASLKHYNISGDDREKLVIIYGEVKQELTK